MRTMAAATGVCGCDSPERWSVRCDFSGCADRRRVGVDIRTDGVGGDQAAAR